MTQIDKNQYISNILLSAVKRFNKDLEAFAKKTDEKVATLYEDSVTDYTLSDVRLENGDLVYNYDSKEERENIVVWDEEIKDYYCRLDGDEIRDFLSFHRDNLRRANRYYQSDMKYLDMIQNGEIEDQE